MHLLTCSRWLTQWLVHSVKSTIRTAGSFCFVKWKAVANTCCLMPDLAVVAAFPVNDRLMQEDVEDVVWLFRTNKTLTVFGNKSLPALWSVNVNDTITVFFLGYRTFKTRWYSEKTEYHEKERKEFDRGVRAKEGESCGILSGAWRTRKWKLWKHSDAFNQHNSVKGLDKQYRSNVCLLVRQKTFRIPPPPALSLSAWSK